MGNSSLAENAIDALAHLIAGNDARKGVVWPKASAHSFDGFELFTPMDGHDDFVLLGEVDQPPIWPMHAVWATYAHPGENHHGADGWGFKRVSTLAPSKWRGRLRYTLPRMVEHEELFIQQGGQSVGSVAPIGLAKGRIIMAGARSHPLAGMTIDPTTMYGRDRRETNLDNEANDIRAAHGFMLRREYLWSVLLGEIGVPRARFVTDAIGVREAFRLRDIPPGRSRRAALRHWVSEHWRRTNRSSDADRSWVRAHLRGHQRFVWNGFDCAIEPSREDLRKNAPDGT